MADILDITEAPAPDTVTPDAPKVGMLGPIIQATAPEVDDTPIDPLTEAAEDAAEAITGSPVNRVYVGQQILAEAAKQGLEGFMGYLERVGKKSTFLELCDTEYGGFDDQGEPIVNKVLVERFVLTSLKDLTGSRLEAALDIIQSVKTYVSSSASVEMSVDSIAIALLKDERITEFIAIAYAPLGKRYDKAYMLTQAARLKEEVVTLEVLAGVIYRFFISTGFSIQGGIASYLNRLLTPLMESIGTRNGG